MMQIFYFFIAIATSTLGAVTGMGGGVMIKPALDILGHYPTSTIGLLSSLSVFSMAMISLSKHIRAKTKFDLPIVIPLALGSMLGGILGQSLFTTVSLSAPSMSFVVIIQNLLLGILIIAVFCYMLNKERMQSKSYSGVMVCFMMGLFLGVISAFLGIGGGPINVLVFVHFFSFDTKKAAISSMVSILFSQLSKLVSVATSTGFAVYDLSVAPFMIVGAILGGILGSNLITKFTEKQVDKAFLGTLIFVFSLCMINIVYNVVEFL